MRDLAIDGNDIMEACGMQPGPAVKKKLQQAFERVLSDIAQRNNKQTILAHLHSIDN